MVLQDRIGYSTSEWDDRYNTDTGYQSGINNFSVSRLHDRLEEIYKDVDGEIFTEDIKNHISKLDLKKSKIELELNQVIMLLNVVRCQIL